jgi:uncharacterized protein YqjF (DUF2071 family)
LPWRQQWREFVSLHWPYRPDEVQRLLPEGLQVDIFDGRAWAGITPLVMHDVRPVGLPPIPRFSHFLEVNVRTFVRGPDGQDGLWFFSLEAGRLPFAVAARASHGVPYTWAAIEFERSGRTLRYTSRRLWPRDEEARLTVAVDVGSPIPEEEIDERDIFLSGRWQAYGLHGLGRLAVTAVSHEPWPLQQATVVELDEGLLAAAGMPPPDGPPVVHYSPAVTVALGLPRLLRG